MTRPIKHLSSPSALVVLLQLILEKEKPQSFIPQVGVFLFLLPLRLCSAPPSHTPFGGDNPVIIPSSPCLQTPLTHSTLLRCPPSFPITPPRLLSYYVLYYFDPSPSICFNWIMICNHVLSGESIKWAGASAPLLRGLLLFPHPTPPPHTHLIQALLLSAFRSPLNTLSHGQPLQPAVGLVKGAEEGGGNWWLRCWFFMDPALQWKGAKRDKVEPSRRERGHRRRRRKEKGCLKPSPAPTKTGTPPPYIKADPPLGRFVRQACNR